jgi:hypothetical protein
MSTLNFKRQLLATGEIDNNLHYGPFAESWWHFLNTKNNEINNKQICFPIRINMRIRIILSDKEFIIRVIVHNTKENNLKPGYVCESDVDSKIYASASELVNETYKKYFKGGARSSGTNVLGFDDEKMVEQLQVDVSFFPFKIVTNGITVFVASIGSSDQEELNFAGSGYRSSFHHRYLGNWSLICQSIIDAEKCQIDIYSHGKLICTHIGSTPADVWNRLSILSKLNRKELFGLSDPIVIQEIKNYINKPCCTLSDWYDVDKMTLAFEKCLKRKIATSDLNWHQFFIGWKQLSTNIIELTTHLSTIYPPDFEITDIVLGAWKRMLQNVGCTNITPYEKKISKVSI